MQDNELLASLIEGQYRVSTQLKNGQGVLHLQTQQRENKIDRVECGQAVATTDWPNILIASVM